MKLVLKTIILFFVVCINGYGQVTVSDSVTFSTEQQSMWEPNSGFSLNDTIQLFDPVTWDVDVNTGDGGITDILGAKFGVGLEAGFNGSMGLEFIMNGFTLGEVDIDYPIQIDLVKPADSSFSAGGEVTLESDFNVLPGWDLTTRFPSAGEIGLDFVYSLGAYGKLKVCFVDCTPQFDMFPSFSVVDERLTLFKLSSIGPSSYPCMNGSIPEICTASAFPIELTAGPVSGSLDIPYVETTDRLVGKNLEADGEFTYLTVDYDIIEQLTYVPGPVGVFFKALKQDIDVGPGVPDATGTVRQITLSYALFTTNLIFTATMNQEFEFEPKVFVDLGFPTAVEYKEVKKSGEVVGTGTSDTIRYEAGNDLTFKYPCDYDFMDLTPTYSLTNEFSNHTFDTYAVDLALSALSFGVDIPKYVVVPEIVIPEVCVSIPFVGSVCTPEITIPEVAFSGYSFSIGPVWSENVNIFAFDVSFFKDSWEMGGFNNNIQKETFRLTPIKFETEIEPVNIDCSGDSTGVGLLANTGGTAPFKYKWSTGLTSQNLTGAPAGTHYVRVTDGNSCVSFASVQITEPDPINITGVISNVDCFENSNGSIDASISGGVQPYSLLWSSGQISEDISGLSAGDYDLTVMDDSSCFETKSFTVTEPLELKTVISRVNHPSCTGFPNGSAIVQGSGGTKPYSYLWSSLDTNAKAIGLSEGVYSVTLTDNNGCTNATSATLIDPTALTTNLVVVNDVTCYEGSDGELDLTVSGGTVPYSYEWYEDAIALSENTQDISNKSAGNYSVIVTDDNDCKTSDDAVISQPSDPISTTLQGTVISCFGGTDGAIELEVSGGTPNYTYAWTNGSMDEDPTGLSAGKHQVTITDAEGCTHIADLVLFQNDYLNVDVLVDDISCFEATDGSLEALVDGGTYPYTYLWSNGSALEYIDGLSEGTYSITVTDSLGCSATETSYVDRSDKTCFNIPTGFTPNEDGYNDTWIIRGAFLYPEIEVKVTNKWGNTVFHSKGYSNPWNGTNNGKLLPEATYYYFIDLHNGDPVYTGPVTIVRN